MPATVRYSRERLLENIDRLRGHLPFAELHYAVKACGEVPVLAAIDAAGLGFETASAEEFNLLRGLSVEPDRLTCGLPLKGPSLTRGLYEAGCRRFVFDCAEEFAAICAEAPSAQKLLRLHITDLDSESARWGMERAAFDICQSEIARFADRIDGLTFHIARNYRVSTLEKVLDRVETWLGLIDRGALRILNIGGGYRTALPSHLGLKHDLAAFYSCLGDRIARMRDRFALEICAEPGRSVVESAGALRTEAMQVKATGRGEIEAGFDLNIGVRPGAHPTEIAILSDAGREVIYDLDLHLNPAAEDHIMCNFVDATCEYEVFYRLPLRRPMRPLEIVEFAGLGAYTTCLSSKFHQRAMPRVEVV